MDFVLYIVIFVSWLYVRLRCLSWLTPFACDDSRYISLLAPNIRVLIRICRAMAIATECIVPYCVCL